MTKATDKLLGELHGKLANSMLAALTASEQAAALLEEYGEELPGAVQAYLVKTADTNPALLTAVSKFLKDNSITCAIEDNEEMSELEERLKKKRERKLVGKVIPIDG
jgi:hypothetical protein